MKYLIGVGNFSMSDDGIGLRIADAIATRKLDKGFEVIEIGHDSLKLQFYFNEDTNRLVLVDCARMGLRPGEWKVFKPDELKSRKTITKLTTLEDQVDFLRSVLTDPLYKIYDRYSTQIDIIIYWRNELLKEWSKNPNQETAQSIVNRVKAWLEVFDEVNVDTVDLLNSTEIFLGIAVTESTVLQDIDEDNSRKVTKR